jgi:hypothetical protein
LLLAGVAWRRRCAGAFLGTAVLVVLAGWIPYRSELPAALATARVFAESWTFNDVVFELLRMCFPGWRLVPTLIVIGVLAGWVWAWCGGVAKRCGRTRGCWRGPACC